MSKNRVQFQKGMSLSGFMMHYATEELDRACKGLSRFGNPPCPHGPGQVEGAGFDWRRHTQESLQGNN
jgi:hypothetical protein